MTGAYNSDPLMEELRHALGADEQLCLPIARVLVEDDGKALEEVATVEPITSVRLAPHQFRTRNDLIEAQQTRSKPGKIAAKSTRMVDSPPLITA